MKVTAKTTASSDALVTICDFSPPRGAQAGAIEDAKLLSQADFLSVAYLPGRVPRVDSAMLGAAIQQRAGIDVVFNLATRDMNKLAMQGHLIGAQMLGLENVVVVKGDDFSEKDQARVKDVSDYTPTHLLRAIGAMNDGKDFKNLNLREKTDFCIGATIDPNRDVELEAALTARKAAAGTEFFITQPIWAPQEIEKFHQTYARTAGENLTQPIFWGVQIFEQGGVIFSNIPDWVRADLDKGRAGTDIALQVLAELRAAGINTVYLVAPIIKGGARKYEAAQEVLARAA